MLRWALLAAAALTEVAGSLSLKAGQDNPGWYGVTVVGYVTAFSLLSVVLRLGVPLGVAYGIWGAAGVALTAVSSAILFGEPLTVLMLLGIVLIAVGVLTVELGLQHASKTEATER